MCLYVADRWSDPPGSKELYIDICIYDHVCTIELYRGDPQREREGELEGEKAICACTQRVLAPLL